ncbi:hypothetical protein D9B78_20950 [Serratia marcescens]|nr:hypothetical protein D9B78_20950 [Serratia marcescens]
MPLINFQSKAKFNKFQIEPASINTLTNVKNQNSALPVINIIQIKPTLSLFFHKGLIIIVCDLIH